MMIKSFNRAALPIALACCAVPAQAADVVFNGSVSNAVSNLGDASACPKDYFHTFVSPTTGTTSSMDSFTYQSDVCQRPGFPINGTFKIVIGDSSFEGTQLGLATPIGFTDGRPTLFNLLINYTILAGTGAYAGATGRFIGTGTVNSSGPQTLISLDFKTVPEPATWAMMLVGFAGIGMAMRRSRARPVLRVV